MMHGFHLFGHSTRQFGMRVSQGASGNTSNTIQIFLAIGVIEFAALAILDSEWVAPVVVAKGV